ncbi:MAG TPA: hypothetical protein VG537_08110 [Candidatus Kapabacteria bacterium]|jgi:predicted nucleotidyltransferase|nr:hypothetical protein [Candidatus Kapabacteria bacterium]
MTHHLPIPKDQIEEFCHRWKVAELSAPLAFISANSQEHMNENGTANADLGLFVKFDPIAEWNLLDRIVMQKELEAISGRSVTLKSRYSANVRHGRPLRRPDTMELLYNV